MLHVAVEFKAYRWITKGAFCDCLEQRRFPDIRESYLVGY